MNRLPHWVLPLFVLSISVISVSAQDLFDADILEMRITFEEADWREVLYEARKAGDNKRLSATVEINGTVYPDVLVRFKGNSSFHGAVKAGYKKIPFNLKAQDDTPFAGGYETLKLSNNFRDPTGVRENLSYMIASTYVPVPKSISSAVYVNGVYLGVYTATEGIDNTMAKRYFIGNKRGLVQCEPDFDRAVASGCPRGNFANLEYLGERPECYARLYEAKDAEEWRQLIRLTRILNDSTSHIEEILDVHLALWMHALNNVLVNLDSYLGFFCHNYYLYRDSEGIYHPLLWDFNLAFGGFHALKEGVEVDFATLSPIVHERSTLTNRPLITKLLEDRLYRHLYFSMMRTITDDWFLNGRYFVEAQLLQDKIRASVLKEEKTFYSIIDFDQGLLSTVETGTRSVPGIQELMEARIDYLDNHPLIRQNTLSVEGWSAGETSDSTAIRIHTFGGVTGARVWFQAVPRGAFRPQVMEAVEITSDFVCTVPGSPYAIYFELQNPDGANLWPLNAPVGNMLLER